MDSFARNVLKNFLRLGISSMLGIALLMGVYCMPTEQMDENLSRSAYIFEQEGFKPSIFSWCSSELDNYTDAIILLNSAYKDNGSIAKQAMNVPRNVISGVEYPSDEIVQHYIDGKPYDGVYNYGRYWHGYLIFMKPLLSFMTYQGIRILNAIVQTCLFGVLVFLLAKRKMIKYLFPYCLSIAFLVPYALAMSLQFSSCYYILTIGSIAVLKLECEETTRMHVFLYIGIVTAFFDFLTYPIVTLGVPICFYYCLNKQDSIIENLKQGINICFEWAFGYFGMWSAKWLLGSIITGTNILEEASEKIAERSFQMVAEDGASFLSDYRFALECINDSFFNTPVKFLLIATLCLLLCLVIIKTIRREIHTKQFRRGLPFIVIAFFPFLWYAVALQHSMWHFWFTCKALVVTVFSVTALLVMVAFERNDNTV